MRDPLSRYGLPYFGYIQIVLEELSAPAGILDAGCGDGRVAAELVRKGCTVTGIDLLDISITYAQTLVPEGRFLVGDLSNDLIAHYGMKAGQFDTVLLIEVYEHLPPEVCPNVLTNLRRVLRNVRNSD